MTATPKRPGQPRMTRGGQQPDSGRLLAPRGRARTRGAPADFADAALVTSSTHLHCHTSGA
jgi:hypothetical protein